MSSMLRYLQVKDYILEGISKGQWPIGTRVPSENELVKVCGVSRMTARRALNELTQEGTLERVQGKGTFVSDIKHKSSMIEIRNIATEIRERGNIHSCQLLALTSTAATEKLAEAFHINANDTLYHSVLLHRENNIPIQLEDRYVSAEVAPDYIQQDFSKMTPNEYLSMLAPISEAEHTIEAIVTDDELLAHFELSNPAACLKVTRTTWCAQKVVSHAFLYHPGSRYQLSSRFRPSKG